MGWLLTSRQAWVPPFQRYPEPIAPTNTSIFSYVEGIDVLYSTNTIFMRGVDMVQHLPQLLLPQRLSSISSVEAVWDLETSGDSKPHNISKLDIFSFSSLLEPLPLTFPHLKTLYISLEGEIQPPNIDHKEFFEMKEWVIMQPVDDLVRKLGPHLQECTIALPASLYKTMKLKATGGSLLLRDGFWDRFWRALGGTEAGSKSATHLQGYWVKRGSLDIYTGWGTFEGDFD
jgi:hypothetical protein